MTTEDEISRLLKQRAKLREDRQRISEALDVIRDRLKLLRRKANKKAEQNADAQ